MYECRYDRKKEMKKDRKKIVIIKYIGSERKHFHGSVKVDLA
jgi:hypothetical protein